MADVNDEVLMAIGRVEGKVDMLALNQQQQSVRLDGIEERLRHVEAKGAKAGAVTGLIMSVGTAIVSAYLNNKSGH